MGGGRHLSVRRDRAHSDLLSALHPSSEVGSCLAGGPRAGGRRPAPRRGLLEGGERAKEKPGAGVGSRGSSPTSLGRKPRNGRGNLIPSRNWWREGWLRRGTSSRCFGDPEAAPCWSHPAGLSSGTLQFRSPLGTPQGLLGSTGGLLVPDHSRECWGMNMWCVEARLGLVSVSHVVPSPLHMSRATRKKTVRVEKLFSPLPMQGKGPQFGGAC